MYIKRIAIAEKGKPFFISDTNVSLSLHEGGVDRTELLKNKTTTSKGTDVYLYDSDFKDNLNYIKRGAAIILPKDLGLIITQTGLHKHSRVLEAGGGSGAATCQLAGICDHVYTYDINDTALSHVKENVERLDLDNVTITKGDITTITPPQDIDMMLLDIPKPHKALDTAKKALRAGGHLVMYTPHISLVQEVLSQKGDEFHLIRVSEILLRDWVVEEQRLRPQHHMLGHTAFLVFLRYFPKHL